MQNFFSSINYKLFARSLVLLVVGYIFLAQGPVDSTLSKSVAPLILVGVYCVLIPVALAVKGKEQKKSPQQKQGV
ncbi:MAG TPA: hypothetical protein PLE24_15635 [Chitinispirillaceae bacterium]|nr:hypothetical protein [Chitinispirillaceae bacterium]